MAQSTSSAPPQSREACAIHPGHPLGLPPLAFDPLGSGSRGRAQPRATDEGVDGGSADDANAAGAQRAMGADQDFVVAHSDLPAQRRRRVLSGSGLEQDLHERKAVLTIIGRTGTGKSSAANVLAGEQPETGPFRVGPTMSSETEHVATVDSAKCRAWITDTPGVFEHRDGVSTEESREASNEHMKSITHYLHSDGGMIMWCIGEGMREEQTRKFIRALDLCYPHWPRHTILMSKAPDARRFKELRPSNQISADEGYADLVRRAADTHDEEQLRRASEWLVANSPESNRERAFAGYITFSIDNDAFNDARFLERTTELLRQGPMMAPKEFQCWEHILEMVASLQAKRTELRIKYLQSSAYLLVTGIVLAPLLVLPIIDERMSKPLAFVEDPYRDFRKLVLEMRHLKSKRKGVEEVPRETKKLLRDFLSYVKQLVADD